MAVISPKLTYEDLLETPDDGKRYEIIDGELFVSASPILPHQKAVGYFFARFLLPAEEAGLGTAFGREVDVVFDQHTVVEPDAIFILAEHSHIMAEAMVQGAPDIVVEALSPSTSRRDLGIKKQLYAREGVPWYFVLDAKRKTVQPFELRAGVYHDLPELGEGDTLACPLLPGISVPVAALFR